MSKEFSWQGRPVFVTGGGGFLGGWLVKALVDRGAQVVCLLRDGVPGNNLELLGLERKVITVRGDICDPACMERALAEYEIDSVFHLAAQPLVGTALRAPAATMEINIRGTWVVLDAIRRTPTVTRTVVASSDKAYGAHEKLPYDEDFKLNALNPYDASKACADILARTYATTYELPMTVTRCGNLYGGGDLNWNRIVPDTIKALIEDRAPVIRSDGKFVRDYLYVEDAAEGYLRLAERTADADVRGQAFNISTGERATVLEVVGKLIEIHGKNIEPQILDTAKAEIREQHLDSAKALRVLGFRTKHDLGAGLKKSYDWYSRYLAEKRGR
jgi:CDP-glucose 4,6-dehydratase